MALGIESQKELGSTQGEYQREAAKLGAFDRTRRKLEEKVRAGGQEIACMGETFAEDKTGVGGGRARGKEEKWKEINSNSNERWGERKGHHTGEIGRENKILTALTSRNR